MANRMTDFDYLDWIFDNWYRCTGSHSLTMIEDKGEELPPHEVKIKSGDRSITNIVLYRFDTETKGDHLPFYNRTHEAPEGLKAFCDYVVLVEKAARLFVVLVEMKRGTNSKSEEQLDAAYVFMDYVLDTAERIKEKNGMPEFSREDVEFRKIRVKRPASNKLVTKPFDLQTADRAATIPCFCEDTLPIHHII